MLPSRWKLVAYGLIIAFGCLFAAPNLFPSSQLAAWPSWLPTKQVALGLDLKGGAHLLLEIDSQALQKEQLQSLLDDAKLSLREARIRCTNLSIQADYVTIRCQSATEASDAMRMIASQADVSTITLALASDGVIRLKPTDEALRSRQQSALEQSVEIVRKRIDAIGVAEPTVQAIGKQRILVQLPGVPDPAEIRKLLGSTAKLTFHWVRGIDDNARPVPAGFTRMPDASSAIAYLIETQPVLQGERIVHAATSIDQRTGRPAVEFRLDGVGAKQFANITRDNVGRPFAIVLDGRVLSAPTISEPILGGSGQITGNFSTRDTASLAAMLRAGALPVPMTVLDQGTVSADLGAEAIRMGATTGVIGLLLVLAFMTVLYRAWGLVANLALSVNVALTLAAATLLGVTLTLPGIAGIVLGIGLAVDANVLINERIREESRRGKSALAALQSGFKRAYAAIVDSNVTTLVATALLFSIGVGPVQGFAITMALGIAFSMFTAVSVVQAVMAIWIARRKPAHFHIGSLLPAALLAKTPTFEYMRARFVGLAVSLVLSVASIVLFVQPGLNYGVDFTGGVMIETRMPTAANLGALQNALTQLNAGEVSLQRVVDSSTVFIRIEQPPSADDATRLQFAELAKTTIATLEPDTHFGRTDVTSPKISGELADRGILAVIMASVAMLIYIWIRFEWHFAVGAIVTLALDVTKVVGFFAVTGIEFNMTAIAALLTLIGYSVNDKVVVYDRMRENLKLFPGESLRAIIDRSINETLARSLYTSATAFLAILPMAVWGGPAVQSFAVPMAFGIVVAASSSIFIAAPILLFLGDWRARNRDTAHDARLADQMRAP